MQILPELLRSRRRLSLAETKPVKIGGSYAIALGQNRGPFSELEISQTKVTSKLNFSTRSTSFRSTKRSSLSANRYDKQKQVYQHQQLSNKKVSLLELKQDRLGINIQSFQIVKGQAQTSLLKSKRLIDSTKQQINRLKQQLVATNKHNNQQLQNILLSGQQSIRSLRGLIMDSHQNTIDTSLVVDRQLKHLREGIQILQMNQNNFSKKVEQFQNTFSGSG